VLAIGRSAVDQCVILGHSLQRAFQPGAQPPEQVAATLAWIERYVGLDQAAIAAWIQEHISERWAAEPANTASPLPPACSIAVASSVLVICDVCSCILRDGEELLGTIPDLLPLERERAAALLRRIADVVQASVQGVVVIAIVQGALCGGMFWVLGIPAAALWGTVTVFASMLPIVGAFAVWGPGALYLAMNRPLVARRLCWPSGERWS
jgi:predicted PurR-regulated permease PerM